MSSDVLQSLIILAAIGVLLFARFLAETKTGRRLPPAAHAVPVRPSPAAAARLPLPPPLPALDTSARPAPIAVTRERRRPRVTLADARTGIVLATILGPCRAHRAEESF